MERYLLFDSLFLTFFFMLAQELLAQEALTRPWWHDSKLWKARPSWWQPRFFSLLEEEQDFSGSGLECQRSSSRLWVWFSLSYSRLRKKWESCQTSFGLEVQQNFSAMEMTLLNCVLPWDFLLLCKSWAFRRTVVKGSVDLWEHLQACRYPVSSVQFSRSFVSDSATPWTAAHQASLSITNSWNSPKPMSIELVMPSNHLILSRPLLLLPPILPSIRVFSNESALCIRWPK